MNRQKAIQDFEKKNLKKDAPKFNVGDTVDVYVKIIEEGKKRIQIFTGVVIKKKGSGARRTFTVRKVSYSEGVERTFPIHSPSVERIIVVKKGNVKRAKLYYLRGKIGKKTKIEEKDSFNQEAAPPDASPRKGGGR